MKSISTLTRWCALLAVTALILETGLAAVQAPAAGQAPGGARGGGRGGARGGQAAQPVPEAPPITGLAPGNAGNGKALYTAHQCWACHGYNGETGGGTRLLNENGTFSPRLVTASTFINYLRAPRPDQAPPASSLTSMPSYGLTSMSNQEAADLLAYIKTFKPTQPAAKDIPLINQMLAEGGKLKK